MKTEPIFDRSSPSHEDKPGDILGGTQDLELWVSQASLSWLHVLGWRQKKAVQAWGATDVLNP